MYKISRTIYLLIFVYMDWFQEIVLLLSIALKSFESFERNNNVLAHILYPVAPNVWKSVGNKNLISRFLDIIILSIKTIFDSERPKTWNVQNFQNYLLTYLCIYGLVSGNCPVALYCSEIIRVIWKNLISMSKNTSHGWKKKKVIKFILPSYAETVRTKITAFIRIHFAKVT